MGERFVVVPVDRGVGVAGAGEHSDAVVADPAPDSGGGSSSSTGGGGGGGGGGGSVEEKEAGEDSVFEQQDPNVVVPILEYNREPNKYGKTAACCKLRVPLLISSVHRRIIRHFTCLAVCPPAVM